jgi:predicted nucleic acid-binding protein
MTYLLDSDVFIQAKRQHYGFDFCPAFWEWMIREHTRGRVYSIAKVLEELRRGNDDLKDWAEARGSAFFLAADDQVAAALSSISKWATSQSYPQNRIDEFFNAADYYLVAHALAYGHTVVTHEAAQSGSQKIKIPDACSGMRITFVTSFEMLRAEKARFVLAS